MKSVTTLLAAVTFAAALCAGSAFATDAKTQTPQQQKFGACAKEAHAKGLKGDEYKAYMSTCAKADAAAPAKPMTQQEKMTTCNADAKTKALAGEQRRKFMSACLSSGPAAAAH